MAGWMTKMWLANRGNSRAGATGWACGLLGLSLCLGTVQASASSSASSGAEIKLTAEVRARDDPSRLRPLAAVGVSQGQEIFYTVRILNPGPEPLTRVSVTQQVPANTRYVAGSATGAGADITFSADGGRSFAKPSELKAPDSSAALSSHYTHIRWQLRFPLAPGAVVLARFRAVFQ